MACMGDWMYLAIAPISLLIVCISYKLTTAMKPKKSIAGKIVLVTGASSGLGKEIAKVFHREGAKVILASRNVKALESLRDQLKCLTSTKATTRYTPEVIRLDLADLSIIPEQAKKVSEIFNGIDIIINNAGISYRGEIMNTAIDVHQQLMTVNYFGPLLLTKELLPEMMNRKEGHIVVVSSIQGKLSIPYRSAYSASKHATQAFFDCLRAEVGEHNIGVSIISPGYIQTNLSMNAVTSDGSQYGVMDATTKGGMSPSHVAGEILNAVRRNKTDVMLAPLVHRLAVYLRPLLPKVFARIMSKRARKLKKKSS